LTEAAAQTQYINATAKNCIKQGIPVISVDTKKKELVGNFKNGGREWQPKGVPELVDVHDFPSDAVGKAIPYGVYDLAANDGSSTSAPTVTPPCSRSRLSTRGGSTSARSVIPTRASCSSEVWSYRPPSAVATVWSGDAGAGRGCCHGTRLAQR
jgi:hypothetical protein